MSLHEEGNENRINERTEKYIKSYEAIENLDFCNKFAENIMNFINVDGFKEKYQKFL